jgi:hypothetical protein
MRPTKPVLLVALVLLAHAGLLWLLQAQWQPKLLIKALPDPVFLTLLRPAASPVRVAPTKPRRAPAPSVAAADASPPASTLHAADAPVEVPAQEAPSPQAQASDAVAQEAPRPAPPDAQEPQKTDYAKPEDTPKADTWPADTRVSYRMRGYYRGEVYGSAKVQWQRQQDIYQVQLDMRMALLFQVSMVSQGRLTEAGLVPQAYEERFLSARRSVAFDREWLRLHDGRQVPKPPGVQDTASQFVELSHRFATGRQTLAVGNVVHVWLARPGGVDFWTYDVTDVVDLPTPLLGTVQAFHLKPRPLANPRGDIIAELWLAPSLQYLPVRVRIALGGDNFVDLLVETIEQGSAPAPAK